MEPEGSLLCSQELATGRRPEPDESSPLLFKIYCNIVPSTYGSLSPRHGASSGCGWRVADCRYGVVPQLGIWTRGWHFLAVNMNLLRNVTQGFVIGRNLWNELGNGKRILDLCVCVCVGQVHLKTVASELAEYHLDPVAV
jgi:hypothetical protein